MTLSRRKFIQTGSLATASMMLPGFLKGFEFTAPATMGEKILVIIQLSGGNDGLNTVIPIKNDLYYKNRAQLSIPADKALKLTDEAGMNPALKGLKQLYDDGKLSIINSVGYEQPNRSHFRSMDIWQTGSNAKENLETGWLGRYLDAVAEKNEEKGIRAIEVDDSLSLALKGEEKKAIAVRDVNQFYKATSTNYFRKMLSHSQEHEERLAGYLYKTLSEATSAADYLYSQSKIYTSSINYPDTALGKRLKTIGSLIVSNTKTSVYYVSHNGFDTHVNQADIQNKLLGQLDDAVMALYNDLKMNNRTDDVLIMTFSEFGRRVAQNASNGTDHGTANNMMFIGGGLKKPGIYNEMPNLTNLDEGDLIYNIDFRQVYATVLDKWLETSSKAILNKKFEHLGFI